MRNYYYLFISLLLLFQGLKAQNNAEIARELVRTQKQVIVKFTETNKSILNELSKKISIDKYKNGAVTAYLSQLQIDDFLAYNYDFNIVQNRALNVLNVATSIGQMSNWDYYPSYSVYMQMMQNYASTYPNICKLDTIGATQDGRWIVALKITDNPNIDEYEPEFLYAGQMHGDELIGSMTLLRLIDYLLTNYSSNSEIADLVNNIEIWINPLTNPDGCYNGGDNDVSNSIRYFSNGVDPNRNYPNPVQGDHPDGQQWAIETLDMIDFFNAHDFVLSANIHSGTEVVNYPWDSWKSTERITADDNWWQFVSHEYADIAQAASPSSYLTDIEPSGVTNGADWYYAWGTRQDYLNYYLHGREFTLELSMDKKLDSDVLPDYWSYNRDALISYIKQAQYGITGIVTDACTGNPIKAKIEINNHDVDNSFVYSSLPIGNFHRPIYSGSYTVVISADGYESQTFNNITVNNYGTTSLNVSLNPTIPVSNFSYELTDACSANYILTNNSPGATNYTWTFPSGDTSNQTNETINFTENGTYSVTLEATNCNGSDSYTQDIIVSNLISIPNTNDVERCGPGSITYSASANGTGSITWYDAPNGNILSTSSDYTTNITSNQTIWVEETGISNTYFGGETDNSGSGGYYTSSTKHSLIFNCLEEVILKSVKVYANGAGNREITLIDGMGNTLYQEVFSIPDGESRVTLNWNIPVGTNLYLQGPATPYLYRTGTTTSANLPYPYDIDNKISITSNTANDNGYYYYFYDWEIESVSCSSPQIPVTATINPLAISAYTYVQNNSEIQFTNTSENGLSYNWDFGDGTFSTEANPIHEFLSIGDFNVILTVSNNCGTDTYSETIGITSLGINNKAAFKVSTYPNPVLDKLYIQIENNQKNNFNIKISDSSGKVIYEKNKTSGLTKIETSHWTKGIYLLQIVSDRDSKIIKIVK